MERGAWWATVHEITRSQLQLSDFHFLSFFSNATPTCSTDRYVLRVPKECAASLEGQ